MVPIGPHHFQQRFTVCGGGSVLLLPTQSAQGFQKRLAGLHQPAGAGTGSPGNQGSRRQAPQNGPPRLQGAQLTQGSGRRLPQPIIGGLQGLQQGINGSGIRQFAQGAGRVAGDGVGLVNAVCGIRSRTTLRQGLNQQGHRLRVVGAHPSQPPGCIVALTRILQLAQPVQSLGLVERCPLRHGKAEKKEPTEGSILTLNTQPSAEPKQVELRSER